MNVGLLLHSCNVGSVSGEFLGFMRMIQVFNLNVL